MRTCLAVLLLCSLAVTADAADRRVVADTAPVIDRDRIAAFGAEVHFAGVALSDDDQPVTLHISDGQSPMVLVVFARTTVEWRFAGAVQRLRAVVAAGTDVAQRSLVSGLPETVPVFRPDPRLAHPERQPDGECPPSVSRSPGGQCLDPSRQVGGDRISQMAERLTGNGDGFASVSVGWRSRTLAVPGRTEAALSLDAARTLLAQKQAEQPEDKAPALIRERLARLGDHPALALAKGDGRELHVVEVGPCLAGRRCDSRQRIIVPPTGRPIVLALRASRDMEWTVETEYGAQLAGIALLGSVAPLGLSAPERVPVAVLLDEVRLGADPIVSLLEQPPGRHKDKTGGWERLDRYLAAGQPITLR